MCGIVGIVSHSPVNQEIYDALTVLQHRGQDAAGIVTTHEGRLFLGKDNGLVRDVFRTDHMLRLQGNAGVGHVRYPTAGVESSAESRGMITVTISTMNGVVMSSRSSGMAAVWLKYCAAVQTPSSSSRRRSSSSRARSSLPC